MRLLLSALIVLAASSTVHAHRLDEYLQAARIALSGDRIELQIDLTPGVAVAFRVLPMIDVNGDGHVSAQEERGYADRVVADLHLEVNGQARVLRLVGCEVPPLPDLAGGLGTVRLRLEAVEPFVDAGRFSMTFRNDHAPDVSAYLVNALVPTNARIELLGQERDVLQRGVQLAYRVSPEAHVPSWWWLVAGVLVVGVVGSKVAW